MKKSIVLFLTIVIAISNIVSPYYAVRADVTVSSVIDGTLYAIGGSFYLAKETFQTGLNILGDIPSVEKAADDTNRLVDEVCSYAETIYQKINGQDTELVNISPDDSPIRYNPDNNTFVYNPTYINNYNKVVQESVTRLDGYYLLDSYIDAGTLRTICEGCEPSESNIASFFERLNKNPYSYVLLPGAFNGERCMLYCYEKEFCGCINKNGYIDFYYYDGSKSSRIINSWTSVGWQIATGTGIYDKNSVVSKGEAYGYFRCYSGAPFKVFYSELDLDNYIQRGKQYYAPKLPVDISIPAPEISTYPTFIRNEYNNVVNNLDSGLTETDIQNMIDVSIENYINNHQFPAVTDTPTTTPGQGASKDYTNILNHISSTLQSFVSSHSSFETKIFSYFEDNNQKLDALIAAIEKLDTGQTSGETNGCKYDFPEFRVFLTSIFEESSGKYDNIAGLLSQNNHYQQQIFQVLDSMEFPPAYDDTDILKSLHATLQSFLSSHSSFSDNICTYFENNNQKLDALITAVDRLDSGQVSGEDNGCRYDYTELNGFFTSLWDKSMGKYDKMIALLKENNQYQQHLIDTLDSIKNILLFDTAIDLLKDRASQTADTAKEKFPTSLPWDMALVVNAMCAAPETPVIKCPVEIKSLNIQEEFIIDLSGEERKKLAKTCRALLSLLFVLYMIHLTRQLITGGDEK